MVSGTTIESSWWNTTGLDLAAALTASICKDGQTVYTGNQPMGGNILTGLGAGSSAGQSVRYEQAFVINVAAGGNLLFTDATYDIGASGATRPRDFFLSRNATIGGTLGVTGATTLASVTGGVIASQSEVNAATSLTKVLTPGRELLRSAGVQVSPTGGVLEQTSIPAGVNRVTFSLNNMSSDGTATWRFQLSTGATYVTTGYLGACSTFSAGVSTANSTTGFQISSASAGNVIQGTITFMKVKGTDHWIASGAFSNSASAGMFMVAGSIIVGGTLDGVRLITTDNFDTGSGMVYWEI